MDQSTRGLVCIREVATEMTDALLQQSADNLRARRKESADTVTNHEEMEIPEGVTTNEQLKELVEKEAVKVPFGARPFVHIGRNGRGVLGYRYASGTIGYSVPIRNGQKDGTARAWEKYFRSLTERSTYKAGKLDGISEKWDPSGIQRSKLSYKDGRLDGESTTWLSDGVLASVLHFKDGLLDGIQEYYTFGDGQISGRYTFHNGVQDGAYTRWNPDGTIREQGTYKRGTRTDRTDGNGVRFRRLAQMNAKQAKDGRQDVVTDSDVRFRKEEPKTLMGIHRLTAENLRHALKMGGLANPSLAVVDTAMEGLPGGNFGEIALIAPSDLVDARKGRNAGTYNRDAWTPRYPRVRYEITKEGKKTLEKILADTLGKDNLGEISNFLIQVQVNDNNMSPEWLEDQFASTEGIKNAYAKEAQGKTFKEYVHGLASQVEMEEYIRGKQRKTMSSHPTWEHLPHTLENVSKDMKKQGKVGVQTFPPDLAFTNLSERYRSLSQIRKNKDRLSGAYVKPIAINRFQEILSDIPFINKESLYDYAVGADDLAEIIAYGGDGTEQFGEPLPLSLIARIEALRNEMREAKVPYFETKFERPVMLNEFAAAVVPENIDIDLKEALESNGLKVTSYDEQTDGALSEAILKATDGAEEDGSSIRFRRIPKPLLLINDTFNEKIEMLNEENKDSIRLDLGYPSPFLRAGGVRNLPMLLYGNKLIKKETKHKYSLTSLRDLPLALYSPMAVFDTKDEPGTRAIITELKTEQGNILVSVSVKREGNNDINVITSSYGKAARSIVHWILADDLRCVDKEKALHYLRSIPAPIAGADLSFSEELNRAIKIVENFVNPKFPTDEHEDVRFRRLAQMNAKQAKDGKQDVVTDSDVRFRATKRGRETIEGWLSKRPDLTEEDKAKLTYVDKEKAQKYLRHPAPIAETSSTTELESASKVVRDFVNPKLPTDEDTDIRFRRAERDGDVSAAAQLASDFYRSATPKNTSLDEVIRFARVYHNSPYLLKKAGGAFVDPETGERLGFDHRFMGKGEGAQAHGWGSYFSVDDLARYAKDVNSFDPTSSLDPDVNEEQRINPEDYKKYSTEEKLWADHVLDVIHSWYDEGINDWAGDPLYAIDVARDDFMEACGYPDRKTADARWDDFVDFYNNTLMNDIYGPRHKYVVEVPDDNGVNYLHSTDDVLPKEQAQMIEAGLKNSFGEEAWADFTKRASAWPDLLSGMVYPIMTDFGRARYSLDLNQGMEWASKTLNEIGIQGIRYDGRQDGECYVIFNENDAKIVDHVRFKRERQDIEEQAKKDGTWMTAPDGSPSLLSEEAWVTAHTTDFKAKFGDWEDPKVRAKSARIDKLIKSEPIVLPQAGLPDLSQMSRKEIREWAMDNLRETYKNEDTGEEIIISRKGIEEVSSHSIDDPIHKMSIAYIPDLIRHSVFLGELNAEHPRSAYKRFRYYAVGLKINGADYTARLSIGVDENGTRYYDHGLTQIEKKKLVGYLNQPAKGFKAIRGEHEGTPHLSSALDKDSKLTTLLQGYIPGDLLEANGEPTQSAIEAYERGEDIRFRKTPTKQEWNGEWYDTPDMRGMTVADAMGLPAAPALPRKGATEPIADYAERVATHYRDPRVRFRTGQRAPGGSVHTRASYVSGTSGYSDKQKDPRADRATANQSR